MRTQEAPRNRPGTARRAVIAGHSETNRDNCVFVTTTQGRASGEAPGEAHEAREVARADSLLADVRNAEDRAERLYGAAEGILERALEAEDLKTALNAIRAAVDVMGEARQYLELRGELTGELQNAADAAANVPMIVRVLSVLRMPRVETVHAIEPGAPPAVESTEAVRSLPAAEVDATVEFEGRRTLPRGIAVEGWH